MEQTESELLALRREKLAALEKLGVAPFGAAFETSGDIARVREKFAEGASFRIAGRITAHRDMGKSHFVDLQGRERTDANLFAGEGTRPGSNGSLQAARSGRFHRRRRNLFHDQNGRADVEGAQAGGAGEITATVAGKMAWLAGRRGALSPALS